MATCDPDEWAEPDEPRPPLTWGGFLINVFLVATTTVLVYWALLWLWRAGRRLLWGG